MAQSTGGKGGGAAKLTGIYWGQAATSGCSNPSGGGNSKAPGASNSATAASKPSQSTCCSGGGVGGRKGNSGGGVTSCCGGSWSRLSSTYASLSIRCCIGGGNSTMMFRWPRSTKGSTRSGHCGLGSMSGRLSIDESRSTRTMGLCGAGSGRLSPDVSDDKTTGRSTAGRCGSTRRRRPVGCCGTPQ